MRTAIIVAAVVSILVSSAVAQSHPSSDETADAITKMRDDMIDAFHKGDLDRLLSHVTTDVVVTWQNGEVSHGPGEIRAYYTKMMTGPNRVVQHVTASPTVEGRHSNGDWSVSWGNMNDRFVLTDGRELALDSRFTAVLLKGNGEWKVQAFHLSTDAFGGAILKTAIATTAKWVGFGAGGAGLIVGLMVGAVWGRKQRGAKP